MNFRIASTAGVSHPAGPVVVDGAEQFGWYFQHDGPLGEVEEGHHVYGVRVGRQHQLFDDRIVFEREDISAM